MSDSEKIVVVLDGENAFPDFADPDWRAKMIKKANDRKAEFSARARKKKRIYKRKKEADKPTA